MVLSCIANNGLTVITYAVSQPSIAGLTLVLKSGAEFDGNRYVWEPVDSVSGHEFVYSIEYRFSGDENIETGAIEITIPRHILKARNGVYADQCVLSIPELSNSQGSAHDFAYTVSGDKIVINNINTISSAAQGYIDIAYVTKRSTFDYRDGNYTDTPEITMTLSENGTIVDTKNTTGAPVLVNTDAQLVKVTKKEPSSRILSWNSAWGEKPADADEYFYLVWIVVSQINATQPYNFKLNDVFTEPDSSIVGYKLSGSNTFSDVNEGYYDTPVESRYDYVLTRHLKSAYSMEQYTQSNSAAVTLTPCDGLDAETQENSAATFRYDRPQFVIPTQGYNAWKYGNTTWSEYNKNSAWDVADYGLTDFVIGTREEISGNVKYAINTITNAYVQTLAPGTDASDPDNYGKVDMTYTLTDDEFYFNDGITTQMEEITIPEGIEPLTYEDYEIEYINYQLILYDPVFDYEAMEFQQGSPTYTNSDILEFYGKFNSDTDWRLIATRDYYTGNIWYDQDYISNMTSNRMDFQENCTAYQIKTSNHHFKTIINATPYCKVKRSDRILSSINNNPSGSESAWLTNLGDYKVTKMVGEDEKTLYYKKINGRDYFIGFVISSAISKKVTSISNDIAGKAVTIGWKVDVSESYITNEGIEYVAQTTGNFYDLLPMGSEVNLSTVSIITETGQLDASAFDVSTIINYNNTGRTLLVVKVKEQFDKASMTYELVQPWESIIDYGENILNSVAYETGNDSIESGHPDDGGDITEYELVSDLDDDVIDEEKFIYAERGCKVSVLIAANSGLTKSVKNSTDYLYTNQTSVRQNGSYVYKLRYNSLDRTKTSNMILFDSLENYTSSDISSDWYGRLQGVDIAQPKTLGIDPVVYYTSVENIDITSHKDLNELDESDEKIWKTAEDFGDIQNATGIAIDMSKDTNGNDFILSGGESIVVLVYMQAPASDTTGKDDPKTYNDVYFQRMIEFQSNDPTVIIPDDDKLDHQAYTEVDFRIMADIRLLKVSSADGETPVKGITFSLVGISDYGTNVNKTLLTDVEGKINFSDIEKGTYILTEVEGNDDYLPLDAPITVRIDNNGGITFDGVPVLDGVYFNIEDEPRLHSDIRFYKRDLVYPALFITDARFSLTGTSKYGSDVMLYASSDENGVVTFPNIEYGTYVMRETNTKNGYILDGNVYVVTVSGDDMFTIAVSKTNGQGDDTLLYSGLGGAYSVYNEPYHSFTLQKEAYGTGEAIPGVVFELKGETNSGTYIDIFKTTTARGQITYENMESGVYTIQEISAPYGYGIDSTLRSVTIDKRGIVTIDGITRNSGGSYVFINKQNGAVTITKKWVDNENNETREQKNITAKIYLSTERSDVSSAKFGAGPTDSTSVLTKVTPASNIKAFKQYTGEDADVQELIDADIAKTIDDGSTSLERIYGWCFTDDEDEYYLAHAALYDLNTFYWWSPAKNVYMTNASRLCRGLNSCSTMDLTGIDTSQVTDMSNLFSGDSSLTFLDLSTFDTSKVTTMANMFYGCSKLAVVDLSSFDTSKVTSMTNMFYNCSGLASLDVSGFNTKNVSNMGGMFYVCSKLTNLDLSSFDTSNVTNMAQMFQGCSQLTNLNLSSFNTSNTINMSQMFRSCSSLTSLDLSNFDTRNVTTMSNMFRDSSKLVTVNISSFSTENVTSMTYMFYGCTKLANVDVSNLNTRNVTDMSYMFNGCSSLTSLDVSHFNTANVNNMTYMFNYCSSLPSLDVSSFNTANVTNMVYMFANCSSLTSLDVSSFETSNVNNMAYMFASCKKITSLTLDAEKFNTANVTNMSSMFSTCSSLTSLDTSRFSTANVTNMESMFNTCSSLTSLDVRSFNTSKVLNMKAMFNACSSLTSLDVSSFDTSNVTTMESMFNYCCTLTSLDLSNFRTPNVTNMYSMFAGSSNETVKPNKLQSIDISNFDTSRVTTMASMFSNCRALSSLKMGDGFVTPNVTNMSSMFHWCILLRSKNDAPEDGIDVSGFRTPKVTTFTNMFYNCQHLTELDVSNFSTDSATSIANMFYNCYGLTSLDLRRFNTASVTNMSGLLYDCRNLADLYIDTDLFNTSKVTNMANMFYNCQLLTSLDVSKFDTGNVTSMASMFNGCKALTALDVSAFDTTNVTSMSSMFSGCIGVTSLDVSNFNTSNVTSMASMFNNCKGLTSLDLSGFDTTIVTSMESMFRDCVFTEIDLSSFDTSLVTVTKQMFYNCSQLKTIYASALWDMNAVTNSASMFSGCSKLKGGEGTSYSPSIVDKTYARIDNPNDDEDGYLTFLFHEVTDPDEASFKSNASASILASVTAVANIKAFRKYSGTDAQAQTIIDSGSAVRLDDGTTNKKIYAWNTSGTINWWSDAGTVYFRQNTNKIFYNLSKCSSIDLTGINTSKVTDMSAMFSGCNALTTLTFGSGFDTSNVTTMENMFLNCYSLVNPDFSGFDTSKVTSMAYMFKTTVGAGNAYTNLDLSSFNTANVTNMEGMFYQCKKLQTLTLSENFDTSKVRSMLQMFYACNALKNFTIPAAFNTQNVTTMTSMFHGCSSLTALDVSRFDTSKVTSMSNMFNGCSNVTVLDVSHFNTANVTNMTCMFYNCVKVAALDVSGFNTGNVTDMSYMFYNCYAAALTSLDVSNFTTNKVVTMTNMFYGCKYITSLDISSFETDNVTTMSYMFNGCSALANLTLNADKFITANVTSMAYMFSGCSNLLSIELSQFNTANVTNMAYMFNGCSKLTELNVSGFNTAKVTNMDHMFCTCNKITALNVSNFNTEKVTSMYYMFSGCSGITALDVSQFNTANVTNMAYMFNGCTSLSTLSMDTDKFDTANVTNMAYMFGGCANLTSLDVSKFNTTNVTSMAYMFSGCSKVSTLDVSSFDTGNVVNMDHMFSGCSLITELDVSSFNTGNVTNMVCMFNACTSLLTLTMDTEKFRTNNVTSMASMFYNCPLLSSLDVSKFDTSKVTSMASMFCNCKNLTELDVSHFNTGNVTNMSSMFSNCQNVKVLDVSRFDTSKVTTMNQMFINCYELLALNLSSFNTSKVTNMVSMFQNCQKVTALDLSSFDTSNISSLDSMLNDCYELKTIDVKSFNTFNVTNMANMFYNCKALTALDLTNFYTAKVTTMYRMFRNCEALETLDLCNFDTANVTEAREMFYYCNALKTIYASDSWSTNKLNDYYSGSMFAGDTKLVGGNGTVFNPSKTNRQYAVPVEASDTTPGYLTKKAATVINKNILNSDDDPCNIVKVTDNIWTYTFTDLNPNLTYYAWEDAAVEEMGDGYEASNLEYSPLTVAALQGTITNTVKVDPPVEVESGNLSITKRLAAEDGVQLTDADLERSFVFTIILTDENGESLIGTSLYGSIPFSNGIARVRIPGGVTTTLSYIPHGYHYTITEETINAFRQSCVNASGSAEQTDQDAGLWTASGEIEKNSTAAVTFTNTKSAVEEKFNSVTLKKLVTGKYEISGSYDFTIALTGLHPSEKYMLSDGNSFDSDARGMATIDVTLTHEGEITIIDLPIGSSYRITESGGDYISSFEIKDSQDLGKIVQSIGSNTVKNTSLSTAAEYVDEDEVITVTFTNEKNVRQNVILKKLMKNAASTNADTFTFNVSLTGLDNNSLLSTSLGSKQVNDSGELAFQFTMSAGENVEFYDLPVGATYQFTETGNEWISSYYLTNTGSNTQFVSGSKENSGAEMDLSTEVETVNEGENVIVTYTNTKIQRDVTLTKIVDMSEGGLNYTEYSNQQFRFTVSFTGLEHNESYTMQYTSKVYSGILKTESFDADADGVAEVTIYLTHQQSVKFKSLPENAKYTISETPTIDYIADYKIIGNTSAVIAKEKDNNQKTYTQLTTAEETVDRDELDIEVIFTNRYHYDPDARIYSVHIHKEIDQKLSAFGTPTFLFRLLNTDTGDQFTCSMSLDGDSLTGSTTVKVTKGHYEVKEIIVNRYSLESSQYLEGTTALELKIDSSSVSIGEIKSKGSMFSFNLNAVNGVPGEAYLKYKNKLTNYSGLSHNDYKLNHVA